MRRRRGRQSTPFSRAGQISSKSTTCFPASPILPLPMRRGNAASTKELWKRLTLEEYKDFSPEDDAGAKRLFERNLQLIAAMHRAGVPFLAGTDTPNPYTFPGFSLHEELGLLVKAGFTPMEALQ